MGWGILVLSSVSDYDRMPTMGYPVARHMKRSDIKTVYHFASN
jgi:hypothetical protein